MPHLSGASVTEPMPSGSSGVPRSSKTIDAVPSANALADAKKSEWQRRVEAAMQQLPDDGPDYEAKVRELLNEIPDISVEEIVEKVKEILKESQLPKSSEKEDRRADSEVPLQVESSSDSPQFEDASEEAQKYPHSA